MRKASRAPRKLWRPVPPSWVEAQVRERDLLRRELGQVRGLIPMLMKIRNGQQWTPEERKELVRHVRSIAHMSPYVVVLMLPGSFIALPILAWWLDRRRQQRDARPV